MALRESFPPTIHARQAFQRESNLPADTARRPHGGAVTGPWSESANHSEPPATSGARTAAEPDGGSTADSPDPDTDGASAGAGRDAMAAFRHRFAARS